VPNEKEKMPKIRKAAIDTIGVIEEKLATANSAGIDWTPLVVI